MRIRWRGFELPTEVVVDSDTLTERYGKFTVEPFERGFGTTVGNGLRRVLLSSLEGAAVTGVHIEGVQHEFATMEGVREDVAEIVLNLKQLRVQMPNEDASVLHLDVEKEGPVTGADLQAEAGVEIVNDDLVICHITEKRRIAAEIEVQKGRGYRTAEENETEQQVVGRIAMDSIFSPVIRANFRTEDTRVGQRTNYDRLVLEVWTDGTVSPGMALVEAGKIFRKHLTPFIEYSEIGQEMPETEAALAEAPLEEGETEEEAPALQTPIAHLGLSSRAENCLHSANIETVGELVGYTPDELLAVRNFGQTSLDEVTEKLQELGFDFGALAGDEAGAGEEADQEEKEQE